MVAKKTKSARERDYKKEYRDYHSKPEQREMEREKGKSALKGKEVDHVIPLSKGGSNRRANLQVISRTANRKKGNK